MREKLIELIKNSYAPYSNVHFACIVEASSGKMYSGVNVENASFGGTICAERNAINNAIANGEVKFKALYLMGDMDELCYPCHICKQSFTEFFDNDVIFNIMNVNGKFRVMAYNEVMATTFSKGDIK